MEKEFYLLIIQTTHYSTGTNEYGNFVEERSFGVRMIYAYQSYDAAVDSLNTLVESQKVLEPGTKFEYYGERREKLFERAKTEVEGWPFDKVLYGVEARTPYNSKDTVVMDRFIIKKEMV